MDLTRLMNDWLILPLNQLTNAFHARAELWYKTSLAVLIPDAQHDKMIQAAWTKLRNSVRAMFSASEVWRIRKRSRTGYIQDGRLQNFHALIVQFKEGSSPRCRCTWLLRGGLRNIHRDITEGKDGQREKKLQSVSKSFRYMIIVYLM